MSTSTTHRSSSINTSTAALGLGLVFTLLYCGAIALLGARLDRIPLLPDTGASWYYWKLPEQTLWGRVSAWGLYLAHQLSIFGLIFWGQRSITRTAKEAKSPRYIHGLRPVNLWLLGVNALFILLHLLQTHLFYDGLAQDVSIWSSQVSVIILLVWVLLLENQRRGLFFGVRVPMRQSIMRAARLYHGYYFAWAIIYTFWYHPTIATSGHIIGFFYTVLLMLQGSLMFTRVHKNRYWTFFLEFLVLAHGTLVAVMQANNMWPMFFFGFAGIFIITQMHGLGLPRWLRFGLLAGYIAGALFVYSGSKELGSLDEIIRIPVIDYLAVGVLALLLWGVAGIASLLTRKSPAT